VAEFKWTVTYNVFVSDALVDIMLVFRCIVCVVLV